MGAHAIEGTIEHGLRLKGTVDVLRGQKGWHKFDRNPRDAHAGVTS